MDTKYAIAGLFLIFVSLGFYFLVPVYTIENPFSSLYGGTTTLSYSLSALNNLCSNTIISLFAAQNCDQVKFASYIVYVVTAVGGILILKGISK